MILSLFLAILQLLLNVGHYNAENGALLRYSFSIGDAWDLHHKFKVDQYTIKNGKFEKTSMGQWGVLRQLIASMAQDGTFTLDSTQIDGRVSINGRESPFPPDPVLHDISKFDSQGNPVSLGSKEIFLKKYPANYLGTGSFWINLVNENYFSEKKGISINSVYKLSKKLISLMDYSVAVGNEHTGLSLAFIISDIEINLEKGIPLSQETSGFFLIVFCHEEASGIIFSLYCSDQIAKMIKED